MKMNNNTSPSNGTSLFQVMTVPVDTIKKSWLVSQANDRTLRRIFISYEFPQISNPTGSLDYKFGMAAYQQYVDTQLTELSFIPLPDDFSIDSDSDFQDYNELVMSSMYISVADLQALIQQMEAKYKDVKVFFHPYAPSGKAPKSVTCRLEFTGINLKTAVQEKVQLSEVPDAQSSKSLKITEGSANELWVEMNPCPPHDIDSAPIEI